MRGLTRALWALAIAGAGLSVGAAAIVARSDHTDGRVALIVIGGVCVWGFIGTGLFAWSRRPDNRFGALLVATGFALLLCALVASDEPTAFTVGLLLSNLVLAIVGHLLLAYPSGRLETRTERRLVWLIYAVGLLGNLPAALFGLGDTETTGCEGCPDPVLLISHDPHLATVVNDIVGVIAVAIMAPLIVVLVRRYVAQTTPQRRAFAPVLGSGTLSMLLLALTLATSVLRAPEELVGVLGIGWAVTFFAIPFAFLAGLLRSRVHRAGAVGDLLFALGGAGGTDGLRGLLANALGDRSLSLAYWLPEHAMYVDEDGRPVDIAAVTWPRMPGRACTVVETAGERVGAILHDASLDEDRGLVRSVGAAAALAMQNEQLRAQLRARVEELHRSRARLLETSARERRRLERDLHDGAQQRLVALSLQLRMAQNRLKKDPDGAVDMLAGAQEELNTALAELRELARGIHPAVLTDRGLQAALDGLAARSPVVVRVEEVPEERLPEAVEAAAYFLVAEALTNVAKYADAEEAVVRVHRDGQVAVVEVSDDGVGGAEVEGGGTGLRGLTDRVAALDGRLELVSPEGGGTLLRAEIPLAAASSRGLSLSPTVAAHSNLEVPSSPAEPPNGRRLVIARLPLRGSTSK